MLRIVASSAVIMNPSSALDTARPPLGIRSYTQLHRRSLARELFLPAAAQFVRGLQPAGDGGIEVARPGQSNVMRKARGSELLALANPRVRQRSRGSEFEIERIALDRHAAEVADAAQQDH